MSALPPATIRGGPRFPVPHSECIKAGNSPKIYVAMRCAPDRNLNRNDCDLYITD